MKPLENGVDVALATQADDTLVQAFARLLPQLSQSAPPLSKADLDEIIHAPCNTCSSPRWDLTGASWAR